jgi:hypothetical protein
MHDIEPYYNWLKYYDSSQDERSPFFGKQYNFDLYSETIYGYYIDPAWDNIGSETLYIKILYTDYDIGFTVMEFIGEWNDAINNDIMNLKRNIIEHLIGEGINKFILIGENIMNFHGSDDCYYEEKSGSRMLKTAGSRQSHSLISFRRNLKSTTLIIISAWEERCRLTNGAPCIQIHFMI